jgi:UbiD family decarboxylase
MDARTTSAGNDLREFVEHLDRNGDLKTFHGADWNLEIGALTEIGAEKGGPALMFDNIKGYRAGFRVLTNFLQAQKRTARALGLPLELSGVELLKAWREKLRGFKPVPPRTVTDGPVLENVMEGDAVDLGAFPTPLWHAHDGGRFIGTGNACVTRDPDTGVINVGTYRCQIQGKNRISVKMNRGKHGRLTMHKYHAKGNPVRSRCRSATRRSSFWRAPCRCRPASTNMALRDS